MIPRRCPVCCAVERTAGAYLCGYRDDGTGHCSDATRLAIRAIGPEALTETCRRRGGLAAAARKRERTEHEAHQRR